MIESVTDHIISIECNLCRGEWMVWVTRLRPSSMLSDHNTNSTKIIYLSTIRQSTVSRQLVSPPRSTIMFHSAQSSPLSNKYSLVLLAQIESLGSAPAAEPMQRASAIIQSASLSDHLTAFHQGLSSY